MTRTVQIKGSVFWSFCSQFCNSFYCYCYHFGYTLTMIISYYNQNNKKTYFLMTVTFLETKLIQNKVGSMHCDATIKLDHVTFCFDAQTFFNIKKTYNVIFILQDNLILLNFRILNLSIFKLFRFILEIWNKIWHLFLFGILMNRCDQSWTILSNLDSILLSANFCFMNGIDSIIFKYIFSLFCRLF
jgi:hypothetical protein